MIVIQSRGQLGNQMFQFAFAYALSQKLHTFFLFHKIDTADKLSYFYLKNNLTPSRAYTVSRYLYIIKLFVHPRVYELLKHILIFIITQKQKLPVIVEDQWKSPDDNLSKVAKHSCYQGFYQSTTYFQNYATSIRELFTIKEKYVLQFEATYGLLFRQKKILVIHIRRSDYIKAGDETLGGVNLSLPLSYYNKCLQQIADLSLYQVIFISDDIAFAKENFPDINALYVQNPEIVDFQILLYADVLIIANSTFAWWAAWLNAKTEKIIFVPKYWLGHKVKKTFPADILPQSWNCIEY